MQLHDRKTAGTYLANRLRYFAGRDDVLVLALPRGGVPVAYEIAKALEAPLDVFTVRKIGMPGQKELALGAVASGNIVVWNEDIHHDVPQAVLESMIVKEREELQRREYAYRGHRPFPDIARRQVILVDDGVATGATMRAALQALRRQGPYSLMAAFPVGPVGVKKILDDADSVMCLIMCEPFSSVSMHYETFPQVSDGEVQTLLHKSHMRTVPRVA